MPLTSGYTRQYRKDGIKVPVKLYLSEERVKKLDRICHTDLRSRASQIEIFVNEKLDGING